MWGLWLALVLAVIAALSSGLALGLHLAVPQWSQRKRIMMAAGLAAFLPMSVAFGGFLIEEGPHLLEDGQTFSLGLLALLVVQVMLFAMICLPPAWFVSSRLEGDENPEPLPEPTPTPLVEG